MLRAIVYFKLSTYLTTLECNILGNILFDLLFDIQAAACKPPRNISGLEPPEPGRLPGFQAGLGR